MYMYVCMYTHAYVCVGAQLCMYMCMVVSMCTHAHTHDARFVFFPLYNAHIRVV